MLQKKPAISVIMPVYNTEKYVGEAIESILNQTFSNFEFIIIDDGSTDKSWEIIQSYARKDHRIKAFQNEENKGISYTRTKLVNLTKTNYIASQDSDDISTSHRLELEFDFLENNLNYGVVSGNNIIIDENGKKVGVRKYTDKIENIILKKSPISQPSSMFRKNIFKKVGGYDNLLNYGEDYDLWLKIFKNGYKIKNIDSFLLKYRIRPGQTKSDKIKETIRNTIFIQKRAIEKYGIKANCSDKIYHLIEKCLLLMPGKFILRLFKIITYKNEK